MRINKYIAERYNLSRRKAEELISDGYVSVNGQKLDKLAYNVSESDLIEINGEQLQAKVEKKYYMLYKPKGVVTTAKEQFGRKCVTDIVKSTVRIFPVGRLDMYSEGLILLTNDGDFTNKIIHPRQHVGKTYELRINEKWNKNDVQKMQQGIVIDDKTTLPTKVEKCIEDTIIITIYEGRNRQLRKMCEALGYKVRKLKRIKIGNLELGNLNVGDYRELKPEELGKIFE